ncbi:MAG: ABC transporter ATP-binding protein [Candidatus Devosia phytovorans]|uniref:ABC transporter ATP-binding protein n=1 Tax=Candidatus Devosia phytovorans TaxID=3121372 RepID=A0AAJ5VSS7_9HYPH|nr:ABC transporter ATP-binding protein [Devosia sp.]WEK02987.1 MAG: ABC transporter ATP-binding protein [Devosia sp.]
MSTAETDAAKPDYLASFKLLASQLGPSRGAFVSSILLATISVIFELTPIWVVYRLVEAVVAGNTDLSFFLVHAGIALGAILLQGLTFGTATALSHRVAFDVIYRIRTTMARHMAKLPLGYFADRRSGDAKKLIIDEPESLELVIAHGLPEGTSALATWFAVSIWLAVVDWRMALASIVMTPIAFAALVLGMSGTGARMVEYKNAAGRMNASIVEYLAGMAVVKIFNRSGESFAETADAVRDYTRVETEWGRAYLPLGGTFYALVLSAITVILPVGAWLMVAGQLDLVTLLFFVVLGANYSQPLMKLFGQFHSFAHVSMGATQVLDMLGASPQSDSGARIALQHHDVCFEDVGFGYGGHDVLHQVSFTARAGEVTALVGPSGSGKSTIASLVPRFWDVREGRVTLGGVDVRDIGLEQLMDDVAFVFQNTFLFSDTIAANIRFGNPDASLEEVMAAASAARAHDFIMALPQGYDTPLGEQGKSLSGGERQRLAIARAILKNAPVIVLDEATAFADPDNEAAIQDAIGALTAGKTLIVVAHRLHTIRDAGQILVVDGGRIVERGRHDELVASGGLYARLWQDYTATQSITLRDISGAPAEAAQ